MSVTYRTNDNKAGAVPVDTVIKTTSTTDGQVQHVNVDNEITVSPTTDTFNVDVLSSVLPSGAATAANQSSLLTELQGKADLTETQPVTIKDTLGNSSMDAATGALQIVAYEHHEIHGGSHYFVRGYQDLAINNVLDFTWQMPNTTKWIHWTWSIETESETNWLVYENAVATTDLANVVTARNNNRNSSNTSGTTMRFELQTSLANANADTDVTGATLLESGIVGAGRNAGQTLRGNEMIMKQNTLYCLRAIATAAGYINFVMDWYEHTNKV